MRLGEIERASRERVDAIAEGEEDATFDPLASNGMPHEEIAVPIEPGAYVSESAALAFDKADTAV